MRRSRPTRSGRFFFAAATLLLRLRAAADEAEVLAESEKRALSTPTGATGAAAETGYTGLSAYEFYDAGEDCTPSPLWFKDVNAESYELGCREIEVGYKERCFLVASVLD